jgi:chorismate-pyruvate lyase
MCAVSSLGSCEVSNDSSITPDFDVPFDSHSAVDANAAMTALTERHFVLQAERPENLEDIDLVSMDASLRNLLFTDGTVTRTLEVQALARVFVEVVSQKRLLTSGQVASHLYVPDGMDSVRRRVIIGTDASTMPVIWAESHIVPSRLPSGFLRVLDDSPDGIGESLQQVKLESWRELLWFGLDSPPGWSGLLPEAEPTVLKRLYRVISQNRPALLISESFAIQQLSGTYHLNWQR